MMFQQSACQPNTFIWRLKKTLWDTVGEKKRNTGHVPARAKAAPYNLRFCSSYFRESKALHTDLEERSKAEAASEKSYMQKMQRLEVDFVCAVPYFLWRAFKLSITCQACALEARLKQAEEAPLHLSMQGCLLWLFQLVFQTRQRAAARKSFV